MQIKTGAFAATIARMHDTAALVASLARQLRADVLETHISWVLLAGTLAYKVKKPLRLPFLDYSTLEKRRHFCDAEVSGLRIAWASGCSTATRGQSP